MLGEKTQKVVLDSLDGSCSVNSERVYDNRKKAMLEIITLFFRDDSSSTGEQVLLIPVGLESTALDSHSNREQRSRFQLESRALLSIPVGIESNALDSSWNQEQCSRFQLESRALLSIRTRIESKALDSNSNREQLLSKRIRIERNCSRHESSRATATALESMA